MMKIIGIEFAANDMNYVVVDGGVEGAIQITTSNQLSLSNTRSTDDLRTFQNAVKTLFNDLVPEIVAIKQKPEKGAMAAGAAALKMEALVLAIAPCKVQFISGARINKCSPPTVALKAYHLPAYKAAACACSND